MIGELERRGARAAAAAVDNYEIEIDPAVDHRLADRENLMRHADAQLDTDRFSAGKIAHLGRELQHFARGREGRMAWR